MNNIVYLSNPEKPSPISSPEALAYRAMILGLNIDKELTKQYKKVKSSNNKSSFGFRFGVACADYIVEAFSNADNAYDSIDKIIKRFAYAVCHLGEEEYSRSIYELNQHLNSSLKYVYENNPEVLIYDINYRIIKILNQSVRNHYMKQDMVSDVFSMYHYPA